MSERRPHLDDFGFRMPMAVRWGDMDALGHVNNAVFFTYDEQARLDYLEGLREVVDDLWTRQGVILARIGADFLSQLKYPAEVEMGFRISRLGRSSMDTEGALFGNGQCIAVTRGVLVWFDYQAQKSKSIPEAVKAYICQRERVAPIEA